MANCSSKESQYFLERIFMQSVIPNAELRMSTRSVYVTLDKVLQVLTCHCLSPMSPRIMVKQSFRINREESRDSNYQMH